MPSFAYRRPSTETSRSTGPRATTTPPRTRWSPPGRAWPPTGRCSAPTTTPSRWARCGWACPNSSAPPPPDEPDTYWNLPGERRGPLLGQIHRAGVRLVLAGHWHRNGIARDGDLEMVVSGPVGYPLGDDPSGFRIVEFAEGKRPRHRYLPLD